MSVPKYRLDAIETIGRKILQEYDPALLDGPPQAVPIETNLANRFVGELMEQLVQDGLLVTTKTRNGPGVHTATDAEISSPLPGQQQMTL